MNALRSALSDRENIISKLRIDLQNSSESAQKVATYVCVCFWIFKSTLYQLILYSVRSVLYVRSAAVASRIICVNTENRYTRLFRFIYLIIKYIEWRNVIHIYILVLYLRQELRIKSLIDELNSLRSALAEREELISKLRVEVHQHTTRIINYKVLCLCNWIIITCINWLKITFKRIC